MQSLNVFFRSVISLQYLPKATFDYGRYHDDWDWERTSQKNTASS